MPTISMLWTLALTRIAQARHYERGEITEKVIIVAVFAALAIAVGAIIVAKVTEKTETIQL